MRNRSGVQARQRREHVYCGNKTAAIVVIDADTPPFIVVTTCKTRASPSTEVSSPSSRRLSAAHYRRSPISIRKQCPLFRGRSGGAQRTYKTVCARLYLFPTFDPVAAAAAFGVRIGPGPSTAWVTIDRRRRATEMDRAERTATIGSYCRHSVPGVRRQRSLATDVSRCCWSVQRPVAVTEHRF